MRCELVFPSLVGSEEPDYSRPSLWENRSSQSWLFLHLLLSYSPTLAPVLTSATFLHPDTRQVYSPSFRICPQLPFQFSSLFREHTQTYERPKLHLALVTIYLKSQPMSSSLVLLKMWSEDLSK